VLAVNDEELCLGLRELSDAVLPAQGLEAQLFRSEEQHGSRDGGLGDCGFVEILELAYLRAGQRSLERPVGPLDLGYELRDIVVLGDARGGDFLAFAVEAADEADLGEQLRGPHAAEVEDSVLLANLGGKHVSSPIPFQAGVGPSCVPWPRATALRFRPPDSRPRLRRRPEI